MLHLVPSCLLVLFLLSRDYQLQAIGFKKPNLLDGLGALTVFSLIVLAAFLIGWAFITFKPALTDSRPAIPETAVGWLTVVASGLATGYLEESYFRFYLPVRLEEKGLSEGLIGLISTALFTVCHLYMGIWGLVNAAAAGTILFLAVRRRCSIHMLAWAHAGYNILVYVIGVFE